MEGGINTNSTGRLWGNMVGYRMWLIPRRGSDVMITNRRKQRSESQLLDKVDEFFSP